MLHTVNPNVFINKNYSVAFEMSCDIHIFVMCLKESSQSWLPANKYCLKETRIYILYVTEANQTER